MDRRWIVGALLVALTGAACTQSQVDPEADVIIHGTASSADGAPLPAATVSLTVEAGPGIVFWAPFVITTFGAACLTDLCGSDHRTTTDGSGAYRFDLKGADVQGTFGEEQDVVAATSGPAGDGEVAGAATRLRFVVRSEQVALPDLQLWQPPLTLRDDGIDWDPATPAVGTTGGYEVVFQSSDARPIWSAPATPTGATLDARVLEDSQGAVAALARVTLSGDGLRGLGLRSGSLAYRSRAGAPASRGAACVVLADDGTEYPQAPCRLTDGDLGSAAIDRLPCDDGGACPLTTGVRIDLDREHAIDTVVIRGCEDCTLDVGGVTTQITQPFAVASLAGIAATEVALRPGLDGFDDLAEVAVWDGRAAGGIEQLATLPASASTDGDVPAPPGRGDGVPTWLFTAATLLLGVTVGAFGAWVLAARARRPGP